MQCKRGVTMQNHEPIQNEQIQGAEAQPSAPQEAMETAEPSKPAAPTRAPATKWIWIAVAGAGLGMCVLCGGALTLLGLLGALSSEQPHARTAPQPHFGGAPAGGNFVPYGGAGADGGYTPYGYSAPSTGYPDLGSGLGSDSSAFPNYDTGGSDFLDSLRQSDAERSWWSEEWSRALGDNYPEPTHVDPDGNPGWVDSSGAFHDYNSGMSDFEASTLGGGGE
jgi:hypothetical protein